MMLWNNNKKTSKYRFNCLLVLQREFLGKIFFFLESKKLNISYQGQKVSIKMSHHSDVILQISVTHFFLSLHSRPKKYVYKIHHFQSKQNDRYSICTEKNELVNLNTSLVN